MVARGGLIAFAVALELVVAYFLVSHPPANVGEVLLSPGGISFLALHVLACILLAAGFGGFLPGGSASDRASVVVLYFIVGFILPIAGIVGVGLLGAVLRRGGKEAEGEPLFKLGNPLLDDLSRGADIPAQPHLEPLAESMRSLDTAQLRGAVLALRGRAEKADAAALLKRFRSDSDSELQFYAGSALAGATDRSEATAALLAGRVKALPDDPLAHGWIAEGLLAAAEGSSDRRLLAPAAIEHLQIARQGRPQSWRLAGMSARAHLIAGDPASAREVLGGEPALTREWLEVLFHEKRWDELRAMADSGAEVRPELREALSFWSSKGEGAAA
jgi:hypothetical protein